MLYARADDALGWLTPKVVRGVGYQTFRAYHM